MKRNLFLIATTGPKHYILENTPHIQLILTQIIIKVEEKSFKGYYYVYINIPPEEVNFYYPERDENFLGIENRGVFDEIQEKPILTPNNPASDSNNAISKDSLVFNLNPSLDIYRNYYICNCYECCCDCCCNCWFQYFFDRVNRIYLKCKLRLFVNLIKHVKSLCFCFIIVGVSFEISFRNAFAILVSDCLQNQLGGYFSIVFTLFTVTDLLLGALFFFATVFLISFLTTRREFLAVNPNDKKTRGRMVFYHLNKGFTYGIFHLCFQMVFKIIFLFERPFYEVDEGSDTAIFSLLKYTFLFLFIMHNYHNWKSTVLIQDDCDVLKFQNRYFTIQNTFLKFVPNQKSLLRFLKYYVYGKSVSSSSILEFDSPGVNVRKSSGNNETKDLVRNFSKDLEMNLCYVKLQLEEQLGIVDRQKFRRILKNQGMYPIFQLAVIYFLLLTSGIYMVVAGICLINLNTLICLSEPGYRVCTLLFFC